MTLVTAAGMRVARRRYTVTASVLVCSACCLLWIYTCLASELESFESPTWRANAAELPVYLGVHNDFPRWRELPPQPRAKSIEAAVVAQQPPAFRHVRDADMKKLQTMIQREWENVKHYILPLNTNISIPTDPVLVTAFDHTHFWEGVALWTMYGRRLQHQYQLIIYDLGLHAWQRHLVRHFFKFPFRIFNFNKYPAHVRNLKNYAFKAAVIQETLQEFGHVFWVDTSFRLQGNGSLDAYVQANKAHAGLTVWHIDGLRQACFIHQGMLDFFDERAKDFVESPANEGGAILVYNYPATYRAIMLPWLVCSLVEKCISPKGAILTPCDFSNKFTSKHCCHRYDQSAMGLILERVFHFDTSLYNSSTTRIHTFDRV